MGVAKVSLLRMYNICVQQPASQAILRRSARSIPMFRADFLPFTSKIVEHSRYLPKTLQLFVAPKLDMSPGCLTSIPGRTAEEKTFDEGEHMDSIPSLTHPRCLSREHELIASRSRAVCSGPFVRFLCVAEVSYNRAVMQ